MSSETANSACDLCGSGELRRLYEVDGFDIVRCAVCGLVFVATPPDSTELLALYGEAYYEDGDSAGYSSYQGAEGRKRLHDRSLLVLLERLVNPGDLFEVGCAYGYFLDEARNRGWRVRGVEPSAHAARHARERLGLDVSESPLALLPLERESQDVVTLWDVIEHLPNPRETVELAHAWLRPGGVLALSTGDIDSFASRLHGADWSLMTPPHHQFFFSRRTMRRLVESAGLELIRFGGDGSIVVDPGARRPRVTGALARVLGAAPVTRIARRLGAGSIMYAYARKPSA